MIDFFIGLFVGSLHVPFLLWEGLAWWGIGILLLCIGLAETFVYKDYEGNAFWTLVFMFFFANYMITPAPDGGWFDHAASLASATWTAFWHYAVFGAIAAIFLWVWYVRKHYVALRDALNDFIAQCGKGPIRGRSQETLDEAQREICQNYKSGSPIPDFLVPHWKNHRYGGLGNIGRDMRAAKNLGKIISFIVLWPFHIITILFGDIIAKIPEFIAKYIAPLLDIVSIIARIGMPKNID